MLKADDAVFLREDVRAEPLVNGFRAWPHLVAPHTYARCVIARHLPALLAALERAEKAKDAGQAAEVRQLMAAIEEHRPHILAAGQAIADLDTLLIARARGFSLESLYPLVPAAIRGLVELVYDRYNSPGVRFLEGALYRTPLYDPALQGVRLEQANPDLPEAGMSVPRLSAQGRLVLPARFDSEAWDLLGRARRRPEQAGDLADLLGTSIATMSPYLTERSSLRSADPRPSEVQVRFLNHACVLMESRRTSVLVDPLLAHRQPGSASRYSFADLPDQIDCLAITHGHLDHFDIETLLQIRHLARVVLVPRTGGGDLVDPSLKQVLQALGFRNVHEMDDYESHSLADGAVTAVPFFGEHSDLAVRGKTGYAVTLQGRTAVFVADSQCLEPRVYELARDQLGPVSMLFVGMECAGSPMATASRPYLPEGRYTPAMSESRRTRASDAAGGLALVRALRPSRAYLYAMGLEPWLAYMFGVPDGARTYSLSQAEIFISACAELGVPAELLRGPRVLPL